LYFIIIFRNFKVVYYLRKGKLLDNEQRRLKILSVEDDTIIGEMLILMLEEIGYEAINAENGNEALEMYNEALESDHPFDIIITDLGMEGINGITLAKEIKTHTPRVPIILLTGFSALVKQGDSEVVDCILRKPIVIDELKVAIAKLVRS